MGNNVFEPLTSSHGNMDGEVAFLRDTFLEAEYDYFKALLDSEKNMKAYAKLIEMPPDVLMSEAMSRIKEIEYGMVKEEDLDSQEAEITFMLAAIRDRARILELIKQRNMETEEDYENGQSMGR